MKDYRQLVEERYIQLMLVSGNSKEVIYALNELVYIYDLELFELLPFCDFLIELLSVGETIDNEDIFKWYELYSKTLQYNSSMLDYVIQSFKRTFLESFRLQ